MQTYLFRAAISQLDDLQCVDVGFPTILSGRISKQESPEFDQTWWSTSAAPFAAEELHSEALAIWKSRLCRGNSLKWNHFFPSAVSGYRNLLWTPQKTSIGAPQWFPAGFSPVSPKNTTWASEKVLVCWKSQTELRETCVLSPTRWRTEKDQAQLRSPSAHPHSLRSKWRNVKAHRTCAMQARARVCALTSSSSSFSRKSETKGELSVEILPAFGLGFIFFSKHSSQYPLSSHPLRSPGFKSFRMTFRPDGKPDVYLTSSSSIYSWKSNPEPVGIATSNMACFWASKCFAKSLNNFCHFLQSSCRV